MPKPMSLEQLRERYLLLQKQATDIAAEMDAIKEVVRASQPIGKYDVDDGKVAVSPNRRFDEATARAVLTAEEIAACTAPGLDSGLVRKLVSPVRYEQCMKTVGDPKVAIS